MATSISKGTLEQVTSNPASTEENKFSLNSPALKRRQRSRSSSRQKSSQIKVRIGSNQEELVETEAAMNSNNVTDERMDNSVTRLYHSTPSAAYTGE